MLRSRLCSPRNRIYVQDRVWIVLVINFGSLAALCRITLHTNLKQQFPPTLPYPTSGQIRSRCGGGKHIRTPLSSQALHCSSCTVHMIFLCKTPYLDSKIGESCQIPGMQGRCVTPVKLVTCRCDTYSSLPRHSCGNAGGAILLSLRIFKFDWLWLH